MRSLLPLALLLGITMSLRATEQPLVVPLWPEGVPGIKAAAGPERDTTMPNDHQVAGKPVIRLDNVGVPTMTIYRAPKEHDTGTAVVVFPGGGYRILAFDLEGTEICQWLNSIGVTAVLVKYRVPEPKDEPRYAGPLQDAGRAIAFVRAHAREWGIRPGHVGVIGFSAGGHLAAVLSAQPKDKGVQPDFTMLVYPAYLSVGDEGNEIAPEVVPHPENPPVFIVQAENDDPFINGTLLYYRELKKAGVAAEMHIYSKGGHGYGLRPTALPVTHWPVLAQTWLQPYLDK